MPPSQSFVAQQAKSLTIFSAEVLAGRRVASPSSEIGRYPVHDISASATMRVGELLLKVPRLPMPALFPVIRSAAVVHAHFGKNGYVIGPLARAAGKPLVTSFHGFDATFRGDASKVGGFNQSRYFAHGRKQMSTWPSWSIAVSGFIQRRLIEMGFPADRVFLHHIGIDTELFRPRAVVRHRNRVVSIARFVEYKGHRYMIDALADVVAAGNPVEFVMVGDGPLRAEIEAYAHQRLPDVKFFNQLSQAEIVDLLASAQLYLHGSVTLDNGHAEAFGLANLEAQAVGTPVVAFDSGGVAEAMEPGRTGYAVGERDTKAMSEAIARLLKDQEMWTSFSGAAQAMVPRRFSIKTQTALLEEFYEQVLERHAGQTGQLRSAA